MKVFLHPAPDAQHPPDNGIGRVIHAQYKYLPQFGVELVSEFERADLHAFHVEQFDFPHVDVIHSHGMYWTGDDGRGTYGNQNDELNRRIVTSLRRTRALTVPSEWVAMPFKRDMRITPDVIPHGIDTDEWTPIEAHRRGPYILWNKNRPVDVCDPMPAFLLAEHGLPVVSTFAPDNHFSDHLQVLGKLPGEQMKDVIRRADVYLATAPETFGVGTLEAMACGVPVLGYNWGGTADIVQHMVNGYLVAPYDVEGLVAGYEWIRERRAQLSDAARARAQQYTWLAACQQYAAVYQRLMDNPVAAPGTAIVIACYNYAQYLAEAIESALNQSLKAQEIVVVDDGSTDNTAEVAGLYTRYGVRYIYQENSGVAEARNRGVRETTAPFVVCLDADDRLGSRYLEAVQPALVKDPGHGIAYTGLGLIFNNGISENRWPGSFNWEWQADEGVPPHTTIPTAATFRRTMWERVGGYRQMYAPGEDAEFYTRGLASGFTAIKTTESALIEYRDHGLGAHKRLRYVPVDGDKPWMRDYAYPLAAPAAAMPLVRSYSEPLISVVMPVGPTHDVYLPRAIASVEGQTWRNWELVIVNDTGVPLDAALMRPYPYARVVEMPPNSGTGAARNAGTAAAKAPLIQYLDADDELMPDAMHSMLTAFTQQEGRYIYSTWAHWRDGQLITEDVPEYDPRGAIGALLHASSVLIARADALAVRFDESLPALEDYDFFARCAIAGVYGFKVDTAMVVVDVRSGTRTQANLKNRTELTAQIRGRYKDYLEGGKVPSSCCGGGGAAVLAVKERLSIWEGGHPSVEIQQQAQASGGVVRMEYTGIETGAQTWKGPSGTSYRGANNAIERYINAQPEDVEWLINTDKFKRVPMPQVEASTRHSDPVERPMVQQHFSPLPVPVEPARFDGATIQATAPAPNGREAPSDPIASMMPVGRAAPLPSAPRRPTPKVVPKSAVAPLVPPAPVNHAAQQTAPLNGNGAGSGAVDNQGYEITAQDVLDFGLDENAAK